MAVAIVICAATSACWAQEGSTETSEAVQIAIRICPSDAVEETKAALGLHGAENLSLEELFDRISDKGYLIEKNRYGRSKFECAVGEVAPSDEVYFVHAGFDETKTYTRHFVIITNSENIVEQIEVQKAFVAP